MATFRCSKCGCDEDTALCNYWSARVRDIPPLCSACDSKIGKWHGEFPRLFGPFLVTPSPTIGPPEVLARLAVRLAVSEGGSRQSGKEDVTRDVAFNFDDPIPSYKPLTASSV
jgi:hypothetical protein